MQIIKFLGVKYPPFFSYVQIFLSTIMLENMGIQPLKRGYNTLINANI